MILFPGSSWKNSEEIPVKILFPFDRVKYNKKVPMYIMVTIFC